MDKKGTIIKLYRLGDNVGLVSLFKMIADVKKEHSVMVYIEQVASRPGQGVASMFSFGEGYGFIQGALTAFKLPYKLVRPTVWTRVMHRGINKKQFKTPKDRSLRVVQQTYPEAEIIPTKCSTPHMGLVDSILICDFGRRTEIQAAFADELDLQTTTEE